MDLDQYDLYGYGLSDRQIAEAIDISRSAVTRWRNRENLERNHEPFHSVPLEERFWEKVDRAGPDECWEWQASQQEYGHGLIRVDGEVDRAHRASWMLHNGDIPNGKCVLHSCHNPPCVNPEHLYIGTHADNARDRDKAGRHVALKGEDHGRSKLTAQEVKYIRRLYLTGDYTQYELADIFDVSDYPIRCIVNGKTWTHIDYLLEEC